jgi:citrate lyase subunit beta/citryl-CoA lyase
MTARSYLFVPGERPDRFQKAWDAGADAVILDLEDGVAPANKNNARISIIEWLSAKQPVYVRLNGPESEWFADDLSAFANRPGLRGIVLPKVESSDQINRVAAVFPKGIDLLPMVETAKGVSKAAELAESPSVVRLGFGALDLQADVGIDGDGEELLYARSRVVMASRVAEILPPVDSVTTALDDTQLLKDNVRRARRLGFGAKFCIHPNQIAAVHEGFAPTAAEVAWAKDILAAVASSDQGAIRYKGQMVERPIVDRAKRILEETK